MTKYIDKIMRYAILAIAVLAEVALLYGIFHYFTSNYAWIESILRLMSIIIVVFIVNNSRHLSSDMFWILLIVTMPVPGTIMYMLIGANLVTSKTVRSLYKTGKIMEEYFDQDMAVLKEMSETMPDLKGDFRYISENCHYPFYRNTGFRYYSLGDLGYPAMLEAIRKAERFIFLEYFIIEEGEMWAGIYTILKEKAAEGIDVRVIYDDAGSLATLSTSYAKKLEADGIKCVCFNRINPIIGAVMNHRDHRKILVVDGKTAFTGGINLADEYINRKKVFGHWKDNCVLVEGDAVWSFTVLFLSTWNALCVTDRDYNDFKQANDCNECDGYIAPYGGSPLDIEKIGQCIYTNIINSSNDYLYISTPYLMIDTDLENSLILAAKKGVDVRILIPGVPDKKLIWMISRSYYRNLIEGGVKIYEYSPGFNHAKTFVSDDRIATVGTFNLDFRSLYLHFENGVYLCNSKKVLDIRDDFLETLKKSKQMNNGDVKMNPLMSVFVGLAKLFVSQM